MARTRCVDVSKKHCYNLSVQQTPPKTSDNGSKKDAQSETTRINHYLAQLKATVPYLPLSLRYVVSDGFYSKIKWIEFLFRDSKQFTGLADCQARDLTKLDFHFNASLTALNLAKWDAFNNIIVRLILFFQWQAINAVRLTATYLNDLLTS